MLGSGEERVFDLRGYLAVHGFSPDGRWIVVERLGELAGDSDLFLLEVETGDVRLVTPHEGSAEFGTPCWLADSSGLFAATNAYSDVRALARYELASGEWRVVLDLGRDVECATDEPGRSLLLNANEDGWSRLELREPDTLELRGEVALPARGVVAQPSSPMMARGSPSASRARAAVQAFVLELDSGELRRLTGDGPIEGADPGCVASRASTGERPVFLFTPQGQGPFPVVLTVHGGPSRSGARSSPRAPGRSAVPPLARLRGRGAERARLDRLREAVRAPRRRRAATRLGA
jgi:hypothetical protein